jgi:hypothetical protein
MQSLIALEAKMSISDYHPPVDQLLTLGETDPTGHDKWPDYLALGIGREHIPELFRMASDESLNQVGKVEGPEDWASIHAVRALGQLHDESTINGLIELLTIHEDHEWIQEELPEVFALVGPAAIPALAAYLADSSHEMYARSYAATALEAIAEDYPESRDANIEAIAKALEQFSENDPALNAFLIGDLAQLKATETLPLIEQAFEADKVDKFVITLNDVLVFMGLKENVELSLPLADSPPSQPESLPAAIDLFNPPPGRISSMSTPLKFSGKKVGTKKKGKRGKKR